jgi:NitT/TauT family transport system substrate-binding protein
MSNRLSSYAWLLLMVAAAGCGRSATTAGPPEPIRVRLLLNWYPEAEHGGFYAALRQGYYRDAGLDVAIVKGGPQAPVIPQVDRGQFEFGIANADGLLLSRAEDATVVALMAPLQTSPRAIMVHAGSGINGFADLKNITIAMNPQPFATFLRRQAPLQGVTVVPYQGSVAQFLNDPKFAQQAYVFSEPFVAKQQGGDPKTLLVADLGFNPYTSVLFTNEAYLRDNEAVVTKMVEASVRGWQHYLKHPRETNQYLHEINPEMSLEALAYGVKALRPLVFDEVGEQQLGAMSPDRWQTLARQLQEMGLLQGEAIDATRVFTTKFLQKPNASALKKK